MENKGLLYALPFKVTTETRLFTISNYLQLQKMFTSTNEQVVAEMIWRRTSGSR